MNIITLIPNSSKYFLLNEKPVFKKYALECNDDGKLSLVSVFDKNDFLFKNEPAASITVNEIGSNNPLDLLLEFENNFAPNFNTGEAPPELPALPKTLDVILQSDAGANVPFTVQSIRSNDLAYFGNLSYVKAQNSMQIMSGNSGFKANDTFVKADLLIGFGNTPRPISSFKSGADYNVFLSAIGSNFFTERIQELSISIIVYPPIAV